MIDVHNYIKYYENVVDKKLCDDIINKNINYETSTYATHTSGKVVKKDRVVSEDFWIKKDHTFYTSLKTTYELVLKKYQTDFPNFAAHRLTDFRISKYNTGGFMSKHIDNIHHSHVQVYGFPQLTILLFLNDNYEGGEFKIVDKTIITKKGSSVVFPSNFIYPHEVLKITKGIRYSITCWLM